MGVFDPSHHPLFSQQHFAIKETMVAMPSSISVTSAVQISEVNSRTHGGTINNERQLSLRVGYAVRQKNNDELSNIE